MAVTFEDSNAAMAGGLKVGDIFTTSNGSVRVVVDVVSGKGGTLPVFEDDSAARSGGLTAGDTYRTSNGFLRIVKA